MRMTHARIVVIGSLWRNGKLLLGKKADDETYIANQWCIPGGKAEPDEDPLLALAREFYQETNLWITSATFLAATIYDGTVFLWYRVEADKNVAPIQGGDLVELCWTEHPDEMMGESCRYPAIASSLP